MIQDVFFVKYADSYLPERMVFQGGDSQKLWPIVFGFYLLRIDDRWILVDVGSEKIAGFVLENYISPLEALKEYGVEPCDVDIVIITHAHGDHIEAVKHFLNADIYIQKDEYERGKKYIPSEYRVHLFDKEVDVANHLHVVNIGGHSIGSSVVEFKRDGQQYVICGDECYLQWNLENKIITGASKCKEKSLYFIHKYSSNQYVPLLCHDSKSEVVCRKFY